MLTESNASDGALARAGLDAVALKPTECDLARATALPVGTVAIDYEGREHVPDRETLAALASVREVRVTAPVRADGFDPLGDASLTERLPEGVGRVLVAGHPAYLSEAERSRAIAPRLGAALEDAPGAWVGTESVERIATATGATQYDLLSGSTERELRALRAAGFDAGVAVYAPTVLADDEDAIVDALGSYLARRRPVAEALPDGAATDATATGRAREILLEAAGDYALAGPVDEVRDRVAALRAAGATTVVGYPARGLDAVLG